MISNSLKAHTLHDPQLNSNLVQHHSSKQQQNLPSCKTVLASCTSCASLLWASVYQMQTVPTWICHSPCPPAPPVCGLPPADHSHAHSCLGRAPALAANAIMLKTITTGNSLIQNKKQQPTPTKTKQILTDHSKNEKTLIYPPRCNTLSHKYPGCLK